MLDQTCSTKLVWSSRFGRALVEHVDFIGMYRKNSSAEHWSSKSSSTKLVWSSRFGRACTFHWYLQEKNSSVEHWSSKSSSTKLVWSSRFGRACTFHWYLQEKTVRLSIGRAKVVLDQTSLVEQVWSSIYISLVFTGKKQFG